MLQEKSNNSIPNPSNGVINFLFSRCISVQMAFEFVAAGIRNGFEFEWSKFGITDEMKRKVDDVASEFGDMFLSTSTTYTN